MRTGPGHAAATLLLALAGALAIALGARGGGIDLSYYDPLGYVRKVEALIAGGLLRHNPQYGAVIAPDAPDEVREFVAASYLAEDIRRFNQRLPNSGLYLKDGALHVDPRAHRVDLPFAPRRRWEGRLLYRRRQRAAILEHGDAVVRVEPASSECPSTATDEPCLPLGPEDFLRLPFERLAGTHTAVGVQLTEGDSPLHFARFEYVGDDLVLTVPFPPDPEVAVNGHRIPEGHRVRLDDGDVLLVRRPGLEHLLFVRDDWELATLRRTREVNGRVEAVHSPGRLPLARDLAGGIEAVVAAQRTRELVRVFDLALTVDRDLHEALQDRLEAGIARLGGGTAPAAVTVLDAANGELLALASWPTPEALARASRLPAGRRQRLSQNQNLVIHPVGSAIKPFLAAALWQTAPELATLTLPAHSEGLVAAPLGFALDKPFEDLGHPAVDRRGFLKVSCNRYMVDSLLLALATRGGAVATTASPLPPGEAATLGGMPLAGRPDLAHHVASGQVLNVEHHPFARALARAFAINVAAVGSADAAVNTAARYDTRPLAPLLRYLEAGDNARPLFAATPERVNLRLNQVQRLREDLVSLALGGATGGWTNVHLAEAMARLGTGRAVEARLVRSIRAQGGREAVDPVVAPPGPVALSERTLTWIREGLALPTTPGGTADALAPDLARWRAALAAEGGELRFLSKTGTAQIQDEAPPWSGVFVFYLEVLGGPQPAALSGAVWVQDRGKAAVAVALARGVLEEALGHLRR